MPVNVADVPESLVEAELFGNVKNYPNAGMPARPGLVGEADGSTLFLDEFAEMPEAMQAHLLRFLETQEYRPVGEAKYRHAEVTVIAATNRELSRIKHDILARFPFRIEVPGLEDRREDIPLLVYHLLPHKMARRDSSIPERFFDRGDGRDTPRVTIELMAWLVTHSYDTHVRELERLLWESVDSSPGPWLEVPLVRDGSGKGPRPGGTNGPRGGGNPPHPRGEQNERGPLLPHEYRRMLLFRQHGWNPEQTRHDPAYSSGNKPMSRSQVDLHLRDFFYRVLSWKEWSTADTARWMAGGNPALASGLQRRFEKQFQGWRTILEEQGVDELFEKVPKKPLSVREVLRALVEGRLK